MYPISQLYDQYLKERARQWAVKVDVSGTEYGMDSIIDFSIENNLTSADDFEIGTAIPSKLVLRLKTENVIPSNARVVPYIALNLPEEYEGNAGVAWQDNEDTWATADYLWNGAMTEWLPLGEFFVDRREKIGQDTWELVCYDKLVYADVAYVSQLSYPATMQAVWDEICTQIGYSYDSSVVIGSYTVPVAPTGYTCRQVMGHIAGANGASVYVGKDGLIKFRRYSASDVPVMEVTDAEYIAVTETGPAKTYTRVVVAYDPDEGLAYEAGSGDENHTLYVEIPFGTQTIADALLVQLSGFSFTPIQMDMRGYPQIEAGDRIRYGRAAPNLTWGGADVAWQDADFSWDGYYDGGQSLTLNMTYSFKGGLSLGIDAPAKSEQESEFGVDGSLTAAINRLNRNAVKLGKTYYGMTVTANDGLTVERSDHKSKIVLNSDVMRWDVDGLPALEYDALAGKLKFRGDIVMEGGSISWSDVNAPTPDDVGALPADSPRLTWIGPTGIYTGQLDAGQITTGFLSAARIEAGSITADKLNVSSLSAISADLGTVTAGSISGVSITGGTIFGAAITGGTITGATIQTSSSYPRIELSGNDLYAYKDASNYIVLDPDGPAITAMSGSTVRFSLEHMAYGGLLESFGYIIVSADNGISLQTLGNIGVPSFNQLINAASSQTLQQALNAIWSSISDLWAAITSLQNTKADKGSSTGTAGPYNGGIPIGTNLMTSGGGVVTWNGIPAHSHTQQ